MRITKLYIKSFKNLKNFTWELNPEYPLAVIVGKNASGKSNLLEAILTIFAQVRTDSVDKKFHFELIYQDIDHNNIILKNDYDSGFSVTRNGLSVDINRVFPKQIVSYYAGVSNRLKNIVVNYRKKRKEFKELDITYIQPIHYIFTLICLFGSKLPRIKKNILKDKFQFETLIEIKYNIQRPIGTLPKKASIENFWAPKANISVFFETLANIGKVEKSANDLEITLDSNQLEILMDSEIINNNEAVLFEYFSEAWLEGYSKGALVSFKKKGIDEELFFVDLSEGEKQRIGNLGTIELFLGNETLYLLDEPDAFAHPRWQWEFVPELQELLNSNFSSQVIFVTHSPLVLSTVKHNAFVMENGHIDELNYLYGKDVDTVLIDAMDTSKRPKQVDIDFENYFILIESNRGETDEAKRIRKDLENTYDHNHPNFSKADMLRALYL